MDELKKQIKIFVVRMANGLKKQIWNNMEIKRIYETLVALVRVVIRILTYPVVWLDLLIENIRQYAVKNHTKPKEPTSKQIRSRMIAVTLDAILENKNSVLGGRALKRWKMWAIALLEIASFITTAIGMTIVASDISPAIAIIWALVIQGLAGSLSGVRGKWNNIILAVCLVFSITSDYVCYVNAVFPYDSYIESQYIDFKTSYDLARERALELVDNDVLSDESIDIVYESIDSTMSLLKGKYNSSKLTEKQDELENVKDRLEEVDATISEMTGHETSIDLNTNVSTESTEYSSPINNPEYQKLTSEKDALVSEISQMEHIIAVLDKIDGDIKNMSDDSGTPWQERIKDLIGKLSNSNTSEADLIEARNQYSALSRQVLDAEKAINNLIQSEEIKIGTITEYDLANMKKSDTSYTQLQNLELPYFEELRETVYKENSSVFDKFFENAATFIDSEFAVNAVDLKKVAEQKMEQVYTKFLEVSAGLANEDEELRGLIYGPASEDDSVIPLVIAKQNAKYQDALSKALSYLKPGKNVIETYSRVVYACLADGLVLLIGFSMRRKRTSIYRVSNRRDLTNEEPRLISEAFYNLAARPLEGDESSTYKIETLLAHLTEFISYFEPAPFIRDANLDKNYSLVCNAENVKKVNSEYKELIGLLKSLGYVKNISVKQYKFFEEYKLNKAAMDGNKIVESLPNLNEKDTEYCYLMTEGFALYFSEKMHDLYQNIETNNYRDEISKQLNPNKEKGVEADAVSA